MNRFRWVPLILLLLVLTVASSVPYLCDGLVRITAWYIGPIAVAIVASTVALLVVIIAAINKQWRPRWVTSTLVVALLVLGFAGLQIFALLPIRFPASLSDELPRATVRLPLDAPVKVGWGGDDVDSNYHVKTPDQRWAYDLLVEPYLTGSSNLVDYGCFGKDVVAPASGEVVVAEDGHPDHTPGDVSGDINAAGNHVAIRLVRGSIESQNTFILIAHLARGSVLPKVGDQVEEGENIGKCGNSGNTSEPHVHIHHQRQNPSQFPIGFAEGLPLFFRDHDGAPMPHGGITEKGDKLVAVGAVVTHQNH